jgi:PAS domain S-box-containing protein
MSNIRYIYLSLMVTIPLIGIAVLHHDPNLLYFPEEIVRYFYCASFIFFAAAFLFQARNHFLQPELSRLLLIAAFIVFAVLDGYHLVLSIISNSQPLLARIEKSFSMFAFGSIFLLSLFFQRLLNPLSRFKLFFLAVIASIAVGAFLIAVHHRLLSWMQVNNDTMVYFLVLEVSASLVFLSAFVRLAYLYRRKRHVMHFWLLMADVCFSFSLVYAFFHSIPDDGWYFGALVLQMLGWMFLMWVPFADLSFFKEQEAELRRSLERTLLQSGKSLDFHQELVQNLTAAVCRCDAQGQIIYFNEKMAGLLNQGRKKLIGQKLVQCLTCTQPEKLTLESAKWQAGQDSQFEVEVVGRQDSKTLLLANGRPILDSFHRYHGFELVMMERRTLAESAVRLAHYTSELENSLKLKTDELAFKSDELHNAQQHYDDVISHLPIILILVDARGQCKFINDYGCTVLGYHREELDQERLPDFITDFMHMHTSYGSAVKAELTDYDAPIKTKKGATLYCRWTLRYLHDFQNQPTDLMCAGQDITALKMIQDSGNAKPVTDKNTFEMLNKLVHLDIESVISKDEKSFFDLVCELLRLAGWNRAVVATFDPASGRAQILASYDHKNASTGGAAESLGLLLNDPLAYMHQEFKWGRAFFIRNVKKGGQPILSEHSLSRDWGNDDVLLLPLSRSEKILGFIFLFEPASRAVPDHEELRWMDSLARKTALYLENRRVFLELTAQSNNSENTTRQKAEMFSTLSHELRTPLNAIITLTSILAKWPGKMEKEQAEQVQIILRNSEKLLRLINHFLDLSRLESGRMEVQYSYFSLPALLNSCAEGVQHLCRQKGIHFEMKYDNNLPPFLFHDAVKIEQVLNNILGNAVKYTENGSVSLKVQKDKKSLELHFQIKDSGIGLSLEEVKHLYEPFQRFEGAARAGIEGTGLGLYLSKHLWELLRGTMTVKSEKGKGTLFLLSLPYKEAAAEETGPVPEKIPAPKQRTSRKGARKKVLVVDDNLDNRYAIKFILQKLGYKALFADNGEEGIQKAEQEQPNIIFMDMMMPGLDGYEATSRIKAMKQTQNIPVIAMTAQSVQDDQNKAIKAGCEAYLSKPFNIDGFTAILEKYLNPE